jgi:hypothetical protein
MSEPAPISVAAELSEEVVQEADEQYLVELEVHSEPETVRIPEAETNSEPARVDGEPQPVRKQGGLLAALFRRRR